MISLTCSLEEYNKLDNDEKRMVFESLANRILLVHPEFYAEAKETEMVDLCSQIQDETKNLVSLPTSNKRKTLRRFYR